MTSRQRQRRRKRSNRRDRNIPLRIPKTADEFFALPEQFQSDYEKSLRVLAKMRAEGLSLKQSAKQADIKPAMVRGITGRTLKPRSNGSYAVTKTDSLLRVLQIATPDGTREIATRSWRDASRLGQYWDAVNKYIRTGDDSRLKKFTGKQIKDANGNKIPLITDHSELNRLGSAGVLSFESLYARSA